MTLIILTVTFVLFVLFSPKALNWAADEIAPGYDISYKDLSGSFFTGLKVKDLRFKNEPIIQTLELTWDPTALLSNEILLHTLSIDGLSVPSSQAFAQTFFSNVTDQKNNPLFNFPLPISIKSLTLNINAFKQYDIDVKKISAEGKALDYYGNGINMEDLSLTVKSNVTNISLNMRVENKMVKVKELKVLDIDTVSLENAIKTMIAVNLHQAIQEEIEPEVEKQRAGLKNYLPQSVEVSNAFFTVQEAKYPLVHLQKTELKLNSFFIDIYKIIDGDTKTMQVSNFSLFADTNLSTLKQRGAIKNSHLHSSGSFSFPHALMKSYGLPLRNNAVEDVSMHIDMDEKEVLVILDMEAKNLLPMKHKDFNVSHVQLKHTLKYSIPKNRLNIHSIGEMDSTYTKAMHIDNDLTVTNGRITYKGWIDPGELTGIDHNDTKLLKDLKFSYTGFDKNIQIKSNLANIDVNISHEKPLQISTKTNFPQNSLLRDAYKYIHFDALSPLQTNFSFINKTLDVTMMSEHIHSNFTLDTNRSDLKGHVAIGSVKFKGEGNLKKKFTLSTSLPSIQKLFLETNKILAFNPPDFDGDVKISLVLEAQKKPTLTINSKNVMMKQNEKIAPVLKDTTLTLGYKDSLLTLDRYHTTFKQQKLFANKPSHIFFKKDTVAISPFWINDEMKVTGEYNFKKNQAQLSAYAEGFKINHKITSLKSRVDIKSTMSEKHHSINGSVTILGGNIYYDMDTKQFDHDRDIVLVKKKKKDTQNPFYDLLETDLKINTQKPLLYKNQNANIKTSADLSIIKKPKGPLKIQGELHILAGSKYTFKGHTFILKESYIYFKGNPKQPILDIAAVYKSSRAQISIQITGSPASPHYIFSSTPHMDKQEILSMLLFDSLDEGDEHSADEMSKLMGSSMKNSHFSNVGDAVAKSIFSSIGMNLDHIPFIGSSHRAKRQQKTLTSLVTFGNENKIKSYPIYFYGQKHFDEKTLQKALAVDRKSSYQFWRKEKPTIKERLLPTLKDSLHNFYAAEGYYDAKIAIKRTQKAVTVTIDEKKPVKIHQIQIQSDYDINDLVTFRKEHIFTAKEFVTVKNNIIDTMMREGFCHYSLDTKAYVDRHKHKVDIAIKLHRGDVCKFGKVTVRGLTTIKDDVVLSRVRAKEGERFNSEKITKSYDALYALDAFDSIYIDYEKQNNTVPIEITGTEIKQPWYVKGGIGWEGDTGIRLSSKILRTNLFEDAKQLSFELVYSSIDKLARFNYFAPAYFRFFDYYLDLTTQLAYNRFSYTDFSEDKLYARSYVSYNGEHLKLHAGLVLENVSLSPFNLVENAIPLGGEDYQLIYPRLQFLYDQRDSSFDPKNGYYISGSVEYALPYKEDASSFYKYEVEGRAMFTFFDTLTLSAVGKIGAISDIENSIPSSKLFFAGGIDSNRAYGYKRMGVTLSPTTFGKIGGSTMANFSLEANYALNENLSAALFSDNTTLNIEQFDLMGEVISSAGVGLRYATPIGPLKVDFGMNVQDSSQNTLHFQLGQSF